LASVESPSDVVTETLAEYLKDSIRGLTALSQFPESNHRFKFPTVSLEISPSGYENYKPYEASRGNVSSNKSTVLYVVGQHNWSIQMDIWHKTKEQAHDLYQQIVKVLNPDIPTKTGLVLDLEEYHGTKCQYIATGVETNFGEESSQRKEWRLMVSMNANHKALLDKEEFIITQTPEIDFDIPDEIT